MKLLNYSKMGTIEELKKENESLKVEMEAKTRVNLFLAEQWRELRHTMDLSKVLGLDEETSNDVAICHVATEFVKLQDENKSLKEAFESMSNECDRLGELETIIWTDFWGYERVEDDTKAYRFRLEIVDMKKENEELKDEKKRNKKIMEFLDRKCRNYKKELKTRPIC
jgi:FtsZ-binding cell division protein ZapB